MESKRVNNFHRIREILNRGHEIQVCAAGIIPHADLHVKVGWYRRGGDYQHRITATRLIDPLLQIAGDDLRMTIFVKKPENGGNAFLVCVVQDCAGYCSGRGAYNLGSSRLACDWNAFLIGAQKAANTAKANRIIPKSASGATMG